MLNHYTHHMMFVKACKQLMIAIVQLLAMIELQGQHDK